MVVSTIFYFFFYLGKSSNLTSIFFKWVVQPPTSFCCWRYWEPDALWNGGWSHALFFLPHLHRQICGQASMFDMATTAQKTKGRSKGMKKGKSSKASKASKSVKKAEPFPDKAGDSFLPFQGACASTDRTSPCHCFPRTIHLASLVGWDPTCRVVEVLQRHSCQYSIQQKTWTWSRSCSWATANPQMSREDQKPAKLEKSVPYWLVIRYIPPASFGQAPNLCEIYEMPNFFDVNYRALFWLDSASWHWLWHCEWNMICNDLSYPMFWANGHCSTMFNLDLEVQSRLYLQGWSWHYHCRLPSGLLGLECGGAGLGRVYFDSNPDPLLVLKVPCDSVNQSWHEKYLRFHSLDSDMKNMKRTTLAEEIWM